MPSLPVFQFQLIRREKIHQPERLIAAGQATEP